MTHIAVRNTVVTRGNKMTESLAQFGVGDSGETLVAMNVRSEIEYKSDVIGTMPEECEFIVIETGANNRILVSSGNVTGWVSSQTDLGQPLTKKTKDGTGDLPIYVSSVQLSMREDMEFKSAVLMILPEGSEFKVIEEGPQNRVKIFVVDEDEEASIGWVTWKTELDQHLIKPIDGPDVTKRMKNLDTYVAKQLSKSEVKRVMSYGPGAQALGEGRSMGKVKSDKPSGSGAASSSGGKEKAPPPALSKMALCCGN